MSTKKVINGIYETAKTHLQIFNDKVVKTFKVASGQKNRYKREKESLLRMEKLSTTPQLLEYDDDKYVLSMSKLPGKMVDRLEKEQLLQLHQITEAMLACGVARHSLPIRDVLIDNDKVNLVDFERVTLRRVAWGINWLIAVKVTHYHLYRITNDYYPELLTSEQTNKLQLITSIRKQLKL